VRRYHLTPRAIGFSAAIAPTRRLRTWAGNVGSQNWTSLARASLQFDDKHPIPLAYQREIDAFACQSQWLLGVAAAHHGCRSLSENRCSRRSAATGSSSYGGIAHWTASGTRGGAAHGRTMDRRAYHSSTRHRRAEPSHSSSPMLVGRRPVSSILFRVFADAALRVSGTLRVAMGLQGRLPKGDRPLRLRWANCLRFIHYHCPPQCKCFSPFGRTPAEEVHTSTCEAGRVRPLLCMGQRGCGSSMPSPFCFGLMTIAKTFAMLSGQWYDSTSRLIRDQGGTARPSRISYGDNAVISHADLHYGWTVRCKRLNQANAIIYFVRSCTTGRRLSSRFQWPISSRYLSAP